jgi:hypothetical protein
MDNNNSWDYFVKIDIGLDDEKIVLGIILL